MIDVWHMSEQDKEAFADVMISHYESMGYPQNCVMCDLDGSNLRIVEDGVAREATESEKAFFRAGRMHGLMMAEQHAKAAILALAEGKEG